MLSRSVDYLAGDVWVTETPKRTKIPPEEPRPCLTCGAPIYLALNPDYGRGSRYKWQRYNPDATWHSHSSTPKPDRKLRETQAAYA